jgi:serine/threonine protein kinase
MYICDLENSKHKKEEQKDILINQIQILEKNQEKDSNDKNNFLEEKKMNIEKLKKQINRIKNEIEIMKECSKNNEYSVKCYDYFQNDNRIGIIMEYCDDNLLGLLNRRECGFNVKEIYEIMYQLNKTFKIMKENKIVHRDIKLQHILIKYENNNILNFICKLAGYDTSIKINDFTKLNEYTGTIITMAPEILELGEKENKKEYTDKCDLWSIV